MKRTTKFILAAVAALGVASVAVPVIAQQTQMQYGRVMGGHGGTADHDGAGDHGGMGVMMGAAQSHAMATFDIDADGTLTPEEITAGIQAEIKIYDADVNGTLSLDEFAAMHAAHTRPMTVRAFQMHDPDGDAQVTEAELAAMAALMQSHMSGQQDGMPGKGMMGNN
ncbi:calcium-binding protein [Pseudorhodobacter sp. W20_MBD10_FR17]|uniref:calcium-binding protein n=1 Tax=Pseudorhodobacter sp. W20_MBD10_FR17 TaxID=3240266 RepID=UPI003F98FA24